MPQPSDMRHPTRTGLLLRGGLLVALLSAFAWWRFPDGTSLVHLFGVGLRHRLTIPVFTIGTVGITPLSLLKAFIFLGLLTVVSSWVRKLLYQRASMTPGFDLQHRYLLARFVSLMIYVVGIMIGLQAAGVNLNSVAVLGGSLGIGIGFGLQSIVANWVAGLVLLIEQPFRIGDRIDVGDTSGVVGRVGVRSTWVRTYDNEVIIVPNSDFTTHKLINWTVNDDRVRLSISVVVAHDSDPHQVADLLLEVARKNPDVLVDPPPEALLADLTQSSLNFVLRFWTIIRGDDNFRLKSDLRVSALRSLQDHGIATGASAGGATKPAAA
jgi:small-conductance mechanosensitive channel